MHTHMHMKMHTNTRTHTHEHTHTHTHLYKHKYLKMHINTPYRALYIYAHGYAHTHACKNKYIAHRRIWCVHTQTHTYTFLDSIKRKGKLFGITFCPLSKRKLFPEIINAHETRSKKCLPNSTDFSFKYNVIVK